MHDALAGTVEIRRQDGIAILTLTRPTANNTITRQMAEAGVAALEEARRDRSITGCVLTGEGDVFCTGGDYQGAGSSSAGRLEFARAHNALAQATSRLGKPLVAAINGNAHAGGFSLIALCDLAVCAEDATLGLPEAAHGLFPLLALAIVKDSLPQKVFFDLVYRARLLNANQSGHHQYRPGSVLRHALCNPSRRQRASTLCTSGCTQGAGGVSAVEHNDCMLAASTPVVVA